MRRIRSVVLGEGMSKAYPRTKATIAAPIKPHHRRCLCLLEMASRPTTRWTAYGKAQTARRSTVVGIRSPFLRLVQRWVERCLLHSVRLVYAVIPRGACSIRWSGARAGTSRWTVRDGGGPCMLRLRGHGLHHLTLPTLTVRAEPQVEGACVQDGGSCERRAPVIGWCAEQLHLSAPSA